jgi:hypothetical protein
VLAPGLAGACCTFGAHAVGATSGQGPEVQRSAYCPHVPEQAIWPLTTAQCYAIVQAKNRVVLSVMGTHYCM